MDGRSANLDSSVKKGTTVSSGDFVNLTAAHLNTDAEAKTVSVGAIGGGEATADAYSNGTLNSHIDGTVKANTFENIALADERALTHGTGYVIALGGLKVNTVAETSPTVSATLGDGATVNATGNAYNMSITEDNAAPHAEAIGIIPLTSPDEARTITRPRRWRLGQGATLTAGGTNVIEPFHNQNVVQLSFAATDVGPHAVSTLGSQPPKITSPNTVTVPAGTSDVLTVAATDPQNDPLTYFIVPSGNASVFAINKTSGELSFLTPPTPESTYVVVVAADNGQGGVDSQTITVNVAEALTLLPGAQREADGAIGGTVTLAQVEAMGKVAEGIWDSTGLSQAQISAIDHIAYQVAPLSNGALGLEAGESITISPDAAQYGWYVDATPTSNAEYTSVTATSFVAPTGSDAAGGVDLLTALLHEQGHVLGLDHVSNPNDLMYANIQEGERRLPSANEAAGLVPRTSPGSTDYLTPAETGDPDSLGSRGANYNRVVADNNIGHLVRQ